jgi:hypothetical protein
VISKKQIARHRDSHFYTFVDLDITPNGIPTSYVVPSVIVADLGTRVIAGDRAFVGELGEAAVESAKSDPKYLNFVMLKPYLERPHPFLEADWQRGFENAYELITMPIFRSAAK